MNCTLRELPYAHERYKIRVLLGARGVGGQNTNVKSGDFFPAMLRNPSKLKSFSTVLKTLTDI